MKPFYALKIQLYRFLNKGLGKFILKILSRFVYVKNLKNSNTAKRKKFLVAITIDTESGHLEKDDKRVWQKSKPEAYIGFYKGIENWRNLLNKYNVKGTFFLSTNCFNAKGNELSEIIKQLNLLHKERHEIGLHLHPDSDFALQNKLKSKFPYTSSKFYNFDQIKQFLITGKSLIKEYLGVNVFSFRWGNWALDTNAVKALQETGFKSDSSAIPGIKGHTRDEMHYNWSKVNYHYPWHLSLNDYQNTKKQDSKILEIPIATFNFMWLKLRADPAYTVLLKASFDYYYKNTDRSKRPFVFVVISHSTEGTYSDGTSTKIIKDTEEFIKYAKNFDDVGFVTMNEAYKKVK